jgi:periplasmic divalent cation tolerance protein
LTGSPATAYNPLGASILAGRDGMSRPILVITSTGSEQQAITIAEELMQLELAACVNIMPSMRSVYRYQGKIFDDEENLLIVKTTRDLFDEVSSVISQLHTYEIPEIIAVDAVDCSGNFLNWVQNTVKQAKLENREENETGAAAS